MSKSTRRNYRFSPLAISQLENLTAHMGVSETNLIENLIAREYGKLESRLEGTMNETDDRVKQVEILRQWAQNMTAEAPGATKNNAAEIVDFWLTETTEFKRPSWYHHHDQVLLIEYVGELLSDA